VIKDLKRLGEKWMIGNNNKVALKTTTTYQRTLIKTKVVLVFMLGAMLSNSANACNDPANLTRDITRIDATDSHPAFHKVDIYCNESWAMPVGSSTTYQYLQRLDASGRSTDPKIGLGFGRDGVLGMEEAPLYPTVGYPNRIDILDTPKDFPYLAISVMNFAPGRTFIKLLILDPANDYKIIKVIDQPLSKFQSAKYGGVASGEGRELEGIYAEEGNFYINTMDEISYSEQQSAVTKRQILNKSPYVREVSSTIYGASPLLEMSIIQNGVKVVPVNGVITLANEPFVLEFEVKELVEGGDVDLHVEREPKFFDKFLSNSTLSTSTLSPFAAGKSVASIPFLLQVDGDFHNSLGRHNGAVISNDGAKIKLRYMINRIDDMDLNIPLRFGEKYDFYLSYISAGDNSNRRNIYGSPAGKMHIIIEQTKALSDHGCLIDGDTVTLTGTPSLEVFPGRPEYESIEEGDEEWKYWILTTNKKYTCGYTLSYESGELYRKEGNYSRFQLANYKFPRKVLSDARNKNIRSDKGVVTITGQIVFGHNAHHVTPMVLFDGILVEE